MSILAKYYLSKLGGSRDYPAMSVASGAKTSVDKTSESPSTDAIIAESVGASANPLIEKYRQKKAEKAPVELKMAGDYKE